MQNLNIFLDDHICSGVTLRVAISDRRNSKPLYNIFSFSSLLLFFDFFIIFFKFFLYTHNIYTSGTRVGCTIAAHYTSNVEWSPLLKGRQLGSRPLEELNSLPVDYLVTERAL